MEEFKYKEEYKYLSNIMLCVTDACNLACRYCFVQQHPNYMSLQTAKDAIDYAWNNYLKKKELYPNSKQIKCSVNFFGGEPMLLFDQVIKPSIEYTKEKNYIIEWGMTTNGTLLNEERIKFLYDNKIGLLFSIDGFKPTQDYNRPYQNGESSFDKIFNIIPYLLKYYPNITFRSTIYEDTVEHCFENYLFAEKMGFKYYFCVPDVLTSKWNVDKINILKEQLHKIFEYRFLQYSNNIIPMKFSKELENFKNIKDLILKQNNNYDEDPLIRCGLGTGLGAIGYNGNIYACQEFASQGKQHKFFIGNIYENGINENKHSELLKTYFNYNSKNNSNNKCNNKNCTEYNTCMFYNFQERRCPAQNYQISLDLNKESIISCFYDQFLFRESLAIFQGLIEKNNSLFKEYILKI